jgi:hypothetical protein
MQNRQLVRTDTPGSQNMATGPLPQCLASLLAGLNKVGPPTIPRPLSATERQTISATIGSLERSLSELGPTEAVAAQVMKFLLAFPGRELSDMAHEARCEMYVDALEDLPAWAVKEGCRRWLRREDGAGDENYSFAPSAPQLRRLAERATYTVRCRIQQLDRLLKARVGEPDHGESRWLAPDEAAALMARVKAAIGPQEPADAPR